MLSLYYKALKANTAEEIISVASQHHEYLLKNNTPNIYPLFTLDDNFCSTFFECISMIHETNQPFPPHISLKKLLITIPLNWLTVSLNPHKNSIRASRSMITGFFTSINWAYLLDLFLPNLFISTPLRKSVSIVTIGSVYQYSIYSFTQHAKKSRTSILDNFGTFVSILGINFANFGIHIIYKKSNLRYLTLIADYVFSLYAAAFIQAIMKNGLSSAINSLVIPNIHQAFHNNDVDYEVDVLDDIPNELICPICYSLLKNPIQCQGHVFCKSCFRTWSRRSNIHPFTGQQYHRNEISDEYVFDVLSKKYRNLLYQNHLNQSGAI